VGCSASPQGHASRQTNLDSLFFVLLAVQIPLLREADFVVPGN
jgi:hypothetical protein